MGDGNLPIEPDRVWLGMEWVGDPRLTDDPLDDRICSMYSRKELLILERIVHSNEYDFQGRPSIFQRHATLLLMDKYEESLRSDQQIWSLWRRIKAHRDSALVTKTRLDFKAFVEQFEEEFKTYLKAGAYAEMMARFRELVKEIEGLGEPFWVKMYGNYVAISPVFQRVLATLDELPQYGGTDEMARLHGWMQDMEAEG